jgi:hypothetical protein
MAFAKPVTQLPLDLLPTRWLDLVIGKLVPAVFLVHFGSSGVVVGEYVKFHDFSDRFSVVGLLLFIVCAFLQAKTLNPVG